MIKKLEKQALLADRAAVADLLASMSTEDTLGRMSFENRLNDIDDQLAAIEADTDTIGSVALMFGGSPVAGSRSIDVNFSTQIIGAFQDLVTKRIAHEEYGKLGSRGRVPLRSSTSLAITDLVRGSVGFVLEEDAQNFQVADSAVKIAIDDVTRVIASIAAEDVDEFERAVESLDRRLLVSLRDFFRVLDDERATLRIIENDRDESLDSISIVRGRLRVDATEISDTESENIVGELLGLLPDSKKFEMRLANGEIIKGTVVAATASKYLQLVEGSEGGIVGRTWRTKMRIREIRERNKPPRTLYSLLGLIDKLQ